MVRFLLPAALLLVAFWVYSIVDCAMLDPRRHRGVSKPVWMLIVILLPVVGGLLWFIVGRSRTSAQPVVRAPDDDPSFLGRIGSTADVDERIKRLEAELAALDDEENALTDATDAADADGEPDADSATPDDDAESPGTRG